MLSFFAAKGGVGCSVVAAAAALLAARGGGHTLLVDLNGDLPSVLGGGDLDGPGLAEWFVAESPLPDSLRRLERPVVERLSLLPMGGSRIRPRPEQARLLAELLSIEGRHVLIDVGTLARPFVPLLAASDRAVLVTRACYLGLRSAQRGPDPDRVVLVVEPGRALRPGDVAAALGVEVDPVIRWDPAVARAVDAGLLTKRLPRSLRPLEALV